jgi:hypothetical protein
MDKEDVMDRRAILQLTAGALLPAGLLGIDAASAQPESLRDHLVGTWVLGSITTVQPDGSRVPLVKGSNVKGLLIFTEGGRMSFQVIGEHPMIASGDRLKMTPEELRDTAESALSFFGTYTVDEANKSLALRIESSTFPNQTAAPATRLFEINGDEMRMVTPARLGGGQVMSVWKRAK